MTTRATKKLLPMIVCFAVFGIHCGHKRYDVRPVITEEEDTRPVAKPKPKKISPYQNAIELIFGQEIDEAVDFPWHVRKIANNHKQAKNLNVLDEVPNSTWFTNRNGHHRMSEEEIIKGPNKGPGPDVSGLLTIVEGKREGVTAGFTVRDQKGDRYILKFDPKGYPELNTAAEMITTKLVYASGYNTPENYLVTIDSAQLVIGENVTVTNRWGREVPMTEAFVAKILATVHRNSDGTFRALASKYIEGEIIGPFHFNETRQDDPNDHIPHHHRRELRGYQVIAAWLNLYDTKANNTLDVYVTEDGKSFVRHYLIDFGTSLGSTARGPAGAPRGKEGAFEPGQILLEILTLGLWVKPWEKDRIEIDPSTGYFTAKYFDPGNYKFIIPNPAFQKATELDKFWAAKIVMSFTDEQIRSAVECGKYSDPEDAAYITKSLIERRNKTGRRWYGQVNPLDNFRFSDSTTNGGVPRIQFDDLAVQAGFEQAEDTRYRYKLQWDQEDLSDYVVSESEPQCTLTPELLKRVKEFYEQKPDLRPKDQILKFKIQTSRGDAGWGKYVLVYFYLPQYSGETPKIIALQREN